MKIRADEHVSEAIVSIIREIGISDDSWKISSVVAAGGKGDSDEHWITKFAAEGGTAILTADKDFILKPPQVQAVFSTGMKIILLPSKWGQASGDLQAAFVLLWWSRIEEKLREMKPRECYRPDWNIRIVGELKKIKIDFQAAQRKLRRSKRSTA